MDLTSSMSPVPSVGLSISGNLDAFDILSKKLPLMMLSDLGDEIYSRPSIIHLSCSTIRAHTRRDHT